MGIKGRLSVSCGRDFGGRLILHVGDLAPQQRDAAADLHEGANHWRLAGAVGLQLQDLLRLHKVCHCALHDTAFWSDRELKEVHAEVST